MSEYEYSRVAVDVVIFGIDTTLKVLVRKREKEPFLKSPEIFGGLLRTDETAEQTLIRKIGREILHCRSLKQFEVFTEPVRDERFRTVSIAYIMCVPIQSYNEFNDWVDYHALPKLAFDHNEIVEHAREFLKENVSLTLIQGFLPEAFPLNTLQNVYEIILDKKMDNRNFRKQMLKKEIIKETELYETNVKHRPARLYQFKNESA